MVQIHLPCEIRNFVKTENGVQWDAVIFSSEFNRNKAFFDIYKLARWKDKLEKILMRDDHAGKYFAYSQDGIQDFNIKTNDKGETEVYSVVRSTNPDKIRNPNQVTAFSIELAVDPKNIIYNENGEYYIDYEWIGLSYLRGDPAGSGDSRILSVKTFNLTNQAETQNKSFMTNDEIKELIVYNNDKLNQTIAKFQQSMEIFAEKMVVFNKEIDPNPNQVLLANLETMFTETTPNQDLIKFFEAKGFELKTKDEIQELNEKVIKAFDMVDKMKKQTSETEDNRNEKPKTLPVFTLSSITSKPKK